MVIYTIYHISYICAITNLTFSFGTGFTKEFNSYHKNISIRVWVSHPQLLIISSKRCRCRDDGIKSGVGVPPNLNHQADNLAKLWQEFLSVRELIAKIFGAVSKTKA